MSARKTSKAKAKPVRAAFENAGEPSSPPDGGHAATEPTFETIASYAYFIWETEGRPAGRDVEHWLQAEAQLRQEFLRD